MHTVNAFDVSHIPGCSTRGQREPTVRTEPVRAQGDPGDGAGPGDTGSQAGTLGIKYKPQYLQWSWATASQECSAFESECASSEFTPYSCNFFSGTLKEGKKKKETKQESRRYFRYNLWPMSIQNSSYYWYQQLLKIVYKLTKEKGRKKERKGGREKERERKEEK